MHEGHRKRMTERLLLADAGLQDHELLEILLFGVLPRRNTNDVAHALLTAFGSLDGVFSASVDQLKTVRGIGDAAAAHLHCVGLCLARAGAQREPAPETFNVETFSAFVCPRFRSQTEEIVEFYCLDVHDRVKQAERFTPGELRKASIAAEEICQLLSSGAPNGLVVAHNHPHGDVTPSPADDRFTAQVQLLCSMHNVHFYDHFIVGGNDYYSYCLVGRMDEIRQRFTVDALFGDQGLI